MAILKSGLSRLYDGFGARALSRGTKSVSRVAVRLTPLLCMHTLTVCLVASLSMPTRLVDTLQDWLRDAYLSAFKQGYGIRILPSYLDSLSRTYAGGFNPPRPFKDHGPEFDIDAIATRAAHWTQKAINRSVVSLIGM